MFGHLEPNEHGDFSIVKTPSSTVKLVTQWLDDPEDGFPSYSDLEKAKFTSQSLGDISRLTIEGMTMGCRSPPDTKPAMTGFQLNFIPGGLIFTVHKHHAALDIAGTTSLIHQIAGNCKAILTGTPAPNWEESLMDRSRFITDIPENDLLHPPAAPGRHPDWHPCSWLLFHLPRSKAAVLKSLATPSNGKWISTHDALTAFLWRIISKHRARIYMPDLSTPALFFEAINMRDRLTPQLPAMYQGNALSAGVSTDQPCPLTLADVISEVPLYQVAEFIRQITTSATQEKLTKTLEALAPFRDKWKLHPRLDAIPPMSLVVTDWRKADICNADFGFGQPVAFRQLSDIVIENMMVIYPPLKIDNDPDKGVEIMVPFERHAVDTLIEDEDMRNFFEFRGFEACPPEN
ncbi:Trichothecene 3-O-acetyltransferase [Cytospora mali]|uniref:Trichothecene 3-O-acetyltransferase n=1 Tax=Cytospora mali TaxID=578113 RepID=A0A194VMJ4_CYTMA|nr:Trichothecene 3-O-acetyltransferase [Valsa mali]